MKDDPILVALMLIAWIGGAAVAKGFWCTVAAYLFAPYVWILFAQYLLGV